MSVRVARRRTGYTIRCCGSDRAWVDVTRHPIPVYLVRGEPGPRGEGYVGYVDLR